MKKKIFRSSLILLSLFIFCSNKSIAQCQASFLYNHNAQGVYGYVFYPNTGVFGSNSYGYTNLMWDFGDGFNSTTGTSSHTYSAPGNYNVCLMVWNINNGCGDTLCRTIMVDSIADCSASVNSIDNGNLNVSYNSVITGTPPFLFDWIIESISYSNNQNTNYTYSQSGSYITTFYMADSNGCYMMIHDSINLAPLNVMKNSELQANLLIFPSPATNNVNISMNEKGLCKYFLYDTAGQIVNQGVFEKNKTIQVDNLKGAYFIRIINAEGVSITRKVLVQ